MEKIIGVIASDYELKERIEKLYSKDIKSGNIIIDLIKVDVLEEQGKILVDKGAQVIIGRGGGYKLILDTVNVPIIPLNMKVIDLLKSIKIASNYSKKIVLILGYDEVDFDYADWKSIINIDIIEEWFKSKYEIRNRVIKYLDQKDDVVIVGSGIACSFARQYKMDSVFINASDDSIKEAIEYSKNLLDSLEEEKFNNEVLRNILDGVKDGIIAIDTNGNIILCNKSAKKILKAEKKDVYNKSILDIFSKMDWLLECLATGKDNKMQIRHINNLVLNTRSMPIKVDGKIHGVIGILQDITKLQKLERKIRVNLNEKGLCAKHTFSDYMYKDIISKEFIEEAKKIGKSDYTTLLYGESGSGKEILAQSIHNISKRKDKPFVAINCATISESLLESELFGYEEGAFTGARKGGKPGLFELAHGGTIFLDEINSLPFYVQNKLLRVIEERQIMRIGSDHMIPLDIRIIAATNEQLISKIKDKTFRADLFYRLSSLEINIPPLRKRKDDIVFLFEYFVRKILKENSLNNLNSIDETFKLSKEEIIKLKSHDWPGNVRELKNSAQKYVITGKIKISQIENKEIKYACLDKEKLSKQYDEGETKEEVEDIDYSKINIDIKEINKYVENKIIDILFNQGLSKTEVAQILGISRTALWKKYNKNV
ncbi:sigma 54-interacting transcriptional regulator [Romboutsia sp.]|uniref:sigma 54-interacting transcriptional regulator n=1 Tax=Romboutsia sp. TaxID=1965302 RepID=UPI002CBA4BFC|nr:sigma 54-interacting transcriptional regulator [Romboutsia sp.]HSQ87436.1 sigma 54-interacting transcriptional regulator [Romboutsia sp.]